MTISCPPFSGLKVMVYWLTCHWAVMVIFPAGMVVGMVFIPAGKGVACFGRGWPGR